MKRNLGLIALGTLAALVGVARGQKAGDAIAWLDDIAAGMADAKEHGRVLMICVNARFVEGSSREERAAKGLREVVYRDPRVVKRSREFTCVFLTPKANHQKLGDLGIAGRITSPQHIFVNSAGDRILVRKEYWSHGQGEKAIEALLALMDRTLRKASGQPETGEGEGAPEDGEARAAWIAARTEEVLKGESPTREAAIHALVKADRDGDCTGPLIGLLPDARKDRDFLRLLVRSLGRDGLDAAALPTADFLGHRDPSIRANAAVSLEYIGCRDRKVVSALMKAAAREKNEAVANHVYRALGRCGVKESSARTLLLKKAASGKGEWASLGPAIGLAYFEGDEKAARGVEGILKKIGAPGGGRGGGQNGVKRAVLSWTLASIGERKSGPFVQEVLLEPLENVRAFWVQGLRGFWQTVARKCGGEEVDMEEIAAGVRVTVEFARRFGGEMPGLMDESREDREDAGFRPKGDGLLGG